MNIVLFVLHHFLPVKWCLFINGWLGKNTIIIDKFESPSPKEKGQSL